MLARQKETSAFEGMFPDSVTNVIKAFIQWLRPGDETSSGYVKEFVEYDEFKKAAAVRLENLQLEHFNHKLDELVIEDYDWSLRSKIIEIKRGLASGLSFKDSKVNTFFTVLEDEVRLTIQRLRPLNDADRNFYHEHLDYCRDCRFNPMLTKCILGPQLMTAQLEIHRQKSPLRSMDDLMRDPREFRENVIEGEIVGREKAEPHLIMMARTLGAKRLIEFYKAANPRQSTSIIDTVCESKEEADMMRHIRDTLPGVAGDFMRAVL